MTCQRGDWRQTLISLAPTVLIDHLLEVLLAMLAGLYGIASLTGFSTSALTVLLPPIVVTLNACALVLASVTMVFGLARSRFGTILPLGLRLLAVTCVAYALALIGLLGLRSCLFTVMFLMGTATMAAWKNLLLRETYRTIAAAARRGAL